MSISVGQWSGDGVAGGNGGHEGAHGKRSLERERDALKSMYFFFLGKIVHFDPFGFKFKSMDQNLLEFAS